MKKNYMFLMLAIVFTVNAMAQNIPNYVPKDGLVGYWPFNGNANDESGNGNNGTVNGATLAADRSGKVNSAYSFNGLNNWIQIEDNATLRPGYITLSAWVYAKNNSVDNPIINKTRLLDPNGPNGGEQYLLFYSDFNTQNTAGSFQIKRNGGCVNGGTGWNRITKNNLTFGINAWHHIAATYDGIVMKLYIDAKLSGTFNPPAGLIDNCANGTFNIGRTWANNSSFNGFIDDISVYNRALTEQEITALYTETPITQNIPSYVPTNGLVGYWPFNGNANDESGNGNHGTVNGATLTADRSGKTNSAYSFDGVSSFIEVKNPQKLDPKIGLTASVWVQILGKNNNQCPDCYQYILSKSDDQTIGHFGVNYSQNPTSYDFFTAVNDFQSNGKVYSNSKFTYPQTNWHNIVLTYNNQKICIYVDGLLKQCTNYSKNLIYNNDPILIGKHLMNSYSYYTNGKIDDIAIYNRALTEQEIAALYSGATNLASTKVYVDAPATVNQNDTLELTISTEALNASDNVIAFQTDFTYDTTRYTYISSNTVGTLNTKGTVDVNTAKNGTLKLGYITQTALSGAGSLVKLKFKANAKVGQGIFGLSNFMYNNTDITSLKNDTVTTLDVTPPSATITLSQNTVRKGDSLLITVKFSEKMADTPAPAFNLTGQNTLLNAQLTKINDLTYTYWWIVEKGNGNVTMQLTQGTDLAGNPFAKGTTITAVFNVLPTLFGDIDTNKFIRAYDAALALQYSVGLNPLPTMDPLPWSNWRIAVANVDTIGNVTANDAAFILKHSIGKITEFPADTKKRGGDAPKAEVTVAREGNQLVFRATGTLYAFNVFMKDNFNAFGQPEVKDKNAMIATNISSTTYNVGLASTTPFTENEPFLILPILTNENVQGTMDIVANAQVKALSYGAAAGISTINSEVLVIYPNPTKDIITILDAQGKTVKIIDVQGKEVYNAVLPNAKTEISLKALGAKGMYVVHILDANNLPVQTKQIVLE